MRYGWARSTPPSEGFARGAGRTERMPYIFGTVFVNSKNKFAQK